MTHKLPKARLTDLLIQETGSELLIYDLLIDKAYCLNETSKNVYQACNGRTTFEDLKRNNQYTDDLIYLTLDELKKLNFLESPSAYVSPFAGMSRREVVRRVGLVTMVALPVISGIVAPASIRAASGCIEPTGAQRFSNTTACGEDSCFDCQCARTYCNANARPCCSGNPYSATNYNGASIFCNC